MTVLDQLVESLRTAATYNRHEFTAPRVVLWPDGDRIWAKAVDAVIREALPELLILDPRESDATRGPSTLVRYRLARRASGESTPIIYLPGVSRQTFRGAPGFPGDARHLFALQYQGHFWTQQNGKDWTPFAFLTSQEGGLGLQLARDRATSEAIVEQLENVLRAKVTDLRGHHLEASDFHKLVTDDPHGMLLQWIASPDTVRKQWPADRWRGFVATSKALFAFDPEKDGQIVAVERLVSGSGAWEQAWSRYREAPKSFVGVRRALDLVQPRDLLDSGNERIPANNKSQEDALRTALKGLGQQSKGPALGALSKLAAEHLKRADSVWGTLGEAPLASAVAQLGILADRVRQGGAGHDWSALADTYKSGWWQIDVAAWKALAAVRENRDMEAVSAALRAVYLPWLEDISTRTDTLVSSYPNSAAARSRTLQATPGTVVVFVDGLRCDLGLELARLLEGFALTPDVQPSWSALPTVTATAKPAWRPLADRLRGGDSMSAAFEPLTGDGRPLKSQGFRELLSEIGFKWFDSSALGDPATAAWTEAGAFDRYGHDDGIRLAWRIEEELKGVAYRIRDLLTAGWKKVLVTSDHGWLLMPGGLPSVQLPAHLTVTKWGRCAVGKPGAQHGFREVPWFWSAAHGITLAPGVSTFRSGMEYAHGGLSLQETLTAFLTVTAPSAATGGTLIANVKWSGLRAQMQIEGDTSGVTVDVRTKPADAGSSLLSASQRSKTLDDAGRISVVIENDDLLGTAAVVVAIRDGNVVAKQTVTIGDN